MSSRKILSCLLLVSYICSICSLGAYAQSAEPTFYVAESFDNYVTNSTPTFDSIKGKNVYITENIEGKSKALLIKSEAKEAGFVYSFGKSISQFVWSFDISVNNSIPSGNISVLNSSGQETVALMLKPDGKLCAYDGRQVGGVGLGKSVHVDLVYQLLNSRYSIYINGKSVLSEWYIRDNSNNTLSSINSVSFLFTGANNGVASEILIDNLYLYSGTEILPSSKLQGKKYVSGTTERSDVDEGAVGSAVYINRTYDEGSSDYYGMTVYAKESNKVQVEEESGNKYLSMFKDATADCLFDVTTPESSEHMMVEFDVASENPGRTWIYFRDTKGANSTLANIDIAGQVTVADGTSIAKLQKNKWTNVAFALDFESKRMNVYVNKRMVLKDAAFGNVGVVNMDFFRIQVLDTNSVNIKLDNLKIYDGSTFRDLNQEESNQSVVADKSIMPTYSDIAQMLSGSVALHVNGGTVLSVSGKKSKLDNPAYIKNGRTLVPVRAVSEGFGLDVAWDGENQKVTIDGNIEMTIGDNKMKVGNKEITLEVAPEVSNGSTFLPLRAMAEDALGKKVFWDDHGLIIISDYEVELDNSSVLYASNYMLYDRPEADTILEKFEKASKNTHPRVMADSQTFDNIKKNYNSGGVMKSWGDKVIALAESYIGAPPVPQNVSGQITPEWLVIPQNIKKRIEALAMAYIITGDSRFAERTYKELENMAGFPSWVPDNFLNISEYMTGFSIGYDWLYDYWNDEQRKFLEETLLKKGLNYSYASYFGTGGWWAKETINWNLVCNGASICAAVALLDAYPDVASVVIENALRGMEFGLSSYYPDGSWPEGIGYWEFATEFVVRACSSLDAAFGEDFNISKAPGLSTAAESPMYANGYVSANNYHDASEGLYHTPLLYYLADKYDKPGIAKARYNEMINYNIYPTTLDLIYCNTNQLTQDSDYPLDRYFKGTEDVSMRTSWEDINGTYLSFHGGYAHVNHGHVDSGTFVIDMLGERIASDLGADSYTHPLYFASGNARYKMYRVRPEGHNMIVINPDESEGISLTSFAEVEKFVSGERGAYSVLNLSDAYQAYVTSYKRGYKLENDRRSVVIRDELSLKKGSSGYWFMHTMADVEIVDNNTAVLTKNGKKFLVRFSTNILDYTLSEMEAKPLPTSPVVADQADNSKYTKLALKFSASGDIYIEMKVIPYDDPESSLPMIESPIAEWTIPSGALQTLPKVDMIYVNGSAVNGFKKSVSSYQINVPYGNGVPQITADVPADCYYEVTPAANLNGTSVLKVISKSNPSLYSFYNITYREVFINVGSMNGIHRHDVVNIIASDNPEPDNVDVNVLDGDLSTRWSACGVGQWIVLDLGTPQKMNAFGIATFNGDKRTLAFSVEVSDDGVNWNSVYTGSTSLTTEIEVMSIPEVSARYVRLTGYGNSSNLWMSVTEFATLYAE